MARLYTDRIMGSTAFAPPGVLNRQVPAGQRWIIRDVIVSFEGTAATYVDVKVENPSQIYWIGHWAAAAGPVQHQALSQAVRELEWITVYTDVDGPTVAMTGYKFLL